MFLVKLLKSFRYAFAGICSSFRQERNFRIHLTAILYVTYFAFLYGLEPLGWAVLILTFSFVLSNELMNTAVEECIDFKSEEWNPHAKLSKDNAAASVLIAAVYSIIVAVFLFSDLERLRTAVTALLAFPRVLFLGLSLVPAAFFVFGFRKYEKEFPEKKPGKKERNHQ